MKKYRAWVNLTLTLLIMLNGFWINRFSMFMALCSMFLISNNVGALLYDHDEGRAWKNR